MDPIEELFSLEFHGIKLGLDNINALLDAADHPEKSYPTIHIGGTNGKGSTVAFLDHILRSAGYRVGRFTSPHLITLNERFMVNGEPISDDALRATLKTFLFHAKQIGITPTFFEMNTAVAFAHFQHEEVDVALIEVGLGGRFDSTNVITPLLSIITNIGLEHTQYLGDTLGEIAFEKAGILKKEVSAVLGNLHNEPRKVILERATHLECEVSELGSNYSFDWNAENGLTYQDEETRFENIPLPLSGHHQGENAATAIRAVTRLRGQFPGITDDAIRSGLESSRWPCRMETVLSDPEVIIDVAHNPDGMRTLASALNREAVFVLSVATDKRAAEMISSLSSLSAHLIITQFEGDRATPVHELAKLVPAEMSTELIADLDTAIEEGIRVAKERKLPLVITGSLFIAGQARDYLIRTHGAPPLQF